MAITKPTEGSVGWATPVNQNFTDIETALAVMAQGFRLTTESGTPVSSSDRVSQATLYLTPFLHNQIGLYVSGAWSLKSTGEVSLALGTLTDAKNYDVFAYWTGSAVALEALAWTSDTARATALVRQDGVWCKTGALDRRYVGTFRTTSTTTTEDSIFRRLVWNLQNRVVREAFANEATDSWTDNGNGTWAAVRDVTAKPWRADMVRGLDEDGVTAAATGACNGGGAGGGSGYAMAVGLDTTTTPDRTKGVWNSWWTSGTGNRDATWSGLPGLGYHYLQALETTNSSTSEQVWGDNGGVVGSGNIGINVGMRWRCLC